MTEPVDAGAGDGIGDELSRARVALGLSIQDVAQQLKFAPRQIEALEQGRYDALPAGAFARGMLRSYARLLKLDAEPLVERIAGRVRAPDNADVVAATRRPIPITDSARSVNRVYALLSLAFLGVIAAVVFEWQRERSSAAPLRFVPAAAQAPAASQPVAVALQVAPLPAEPQRIASAGTGVPLAAQPAPADESAPAEGTRRIVMKFDRNSWVEIRGHDGKALISQLNPAGSERTVQGRPPFALVIGNAQYVRLSYDDRPIDLAPYVKVEVARFTLD